MTARDFKELIDYYVNVCRLAAEQGHPHASHNLAVGHLKGYHKLKSG